MFKLQEKVIFQHPVALFMSQVYNSLYKFWGFPMLKLFPVLDLPKSGIVVFSDLGRSSTWNNFNIGNPQNLYKLLYTHFIFYNLTSHRF
jgi:hypothetical protein